MDLRESPVATPIIRDANIGRDLFELVGLSPVEIGIIFNFDRHTPVEVSALVVGGLIAGIYRDLHLGTSVGETGTLTGEIVVRIGKIVDGLVDLLPALVLELRLTVV